MSFKQATTEAPADADFVAFANIGGWVIVQRRSDGIWDVCANTNGVGYGLFALGISAQRKSLWSLDSRQFVVGTVEQLKRHMVQYA